MQQLRFDELPLSEWILEAISALGFEQATPIQSQAIPVLLEGMDMIGQAQTGTGKTFAFGLPLLEKIDLNKKQVQALVLCPTRELANQVCDELKKITNGTNLYVLPVFGGDSIERQITMLKKGVHVVVGTPGRVMDMMRRRVLKFDHIQYFVLDEADEMLSMGFIEDIEEIMQAMPEEKQTALFSATMSREIRNLTTKYLVSPVTVSIEKTALTAPKIDQFYFEIDNNLKTEAVKRLIEFHQLTKVMVFCNTKKMVDDLMEVLQMDGMAVEGLHGDMKQTSRNGVMARFKKGLVNVLIATDVAARGIDVNNIEAVINYDLPGDNEFYVHRIGRTARAGRKGMSFTFISRRDFGKLKYIEKYTNDKINKGKVPTLKEIAFLRRQKFIDKVKDTAEHTEDWENIDLINDLFNLGLDSHEIIRSMVKLYLGDIKQAESDIIERYYQKMESFKPEDRGERKPFKKAGFGPNVSSPGMVKMMLGVGHKNQIKPRDIVGAITSSANVRGKQIGHIEIFDQHCLVEIPEREAQHIIRSMQKNGIRGRRIEAELA